MAWRPATRAPVHAQMQQPPKSAASSRPRETLPVTWRAVIVGLVLIPPNVWFVIHGLFWGQSRPTTVSLIFNVIATLFLLVLLNGLLRRMRPRWALSRGELLVIYAMLSVASAVCGLDQIQTMVEVVAHPIWGATPENRWEDLFLGQMPGWVTVTDEAALRAYFDSRMPMLATPDWRPWLPVALVWAGFSFTL